MTTVVNNGASTLRAAYNPGDGVLKVRAGDGALFGASFPLRVTVQQAGNGAWSIFRVTGRVADDLTVGSTDEGTADRYYAAGAAVENRWTAGAVAELPQLGQPNVFAASQTVHAHSATGAGAVVDGPDPLARWPAPAICGNFSEVSTDAPGGSASKIGVASVMGANPSGDVAATSYSAFAAEAFVAPANARHVSRLFGLWTTVAHDGTGLLDHAEGAFLQVRNESSGTVTEIIGLDVYCVVAAAASTDHVYGIWVEPTNRAGTLRANIGILIGDQSDPAYSVHYNLQSTGANSRNSFDGWVGVGVGTPTPSAKLEVSTTTGGFLPPRMTTTQRNAIATPAEGLVVYDVTLHALCFRRAADWLVIGGAPGTTLEAVEPEEEQEPPAEEDWSR